MDTLYYYKKCSTCRKTLRFLEEHDIKLEMIDYTEFPINKATLKEIWEKSGLPLKRLFNTSGIIYRDMGLKDKLETMSEDEQLTLLSEHAMLVKRPILLTKNKALLGFKQAEWEALLLK